jgi:cation:H+ antiporter
MTALILIGGLVLLLIGGEALVRGSVAIAERLGLSPLFVGMVVAGFGTSMPELVVGVQATMEGKPAIAAGNVIGSNIANILLILGLAAVISPIGRPPRLFKPDGFILLAVTAGIVLIGLQGRIPAWQGGVMVLLLGGFILFQYLRDKRDAASKVVEEVPLPLPEELPRRPLVALLLLAAGFGGLIGGADLFVEGAVRVARGLGVSEGLIGLTIVAVGTSLPELAATTVAALRRHTDLAYGNILGSNLFNILGILGISSIAGPLVVPPVMVWLDGPVMIAATLAMLMFLATGARLVRWEGAVMVAAFAIYVGGRYAYGVG